MLIACLSMVSWLSDFFFPLLVIVLEGSANGEKLQMELQSLNSKGWW